MILIAFFVALHALSVFFEGLDILFYALRAVLSSYPGILVTVAASAYLAYRWYRARTAGTP